MKNLSRQANNSDLFNLAIDTEYMDKDNNIDIFYSYDGLNVNKIEDMLNLSDISDLDKIEEISEPDNLNVIIEEQEERTVMCIKIWYLNPSKIKVQFMI